METYKEYILSKKDFIYEVLDEMSRLKKEDVSHGINGIVENFLDVITLYMDPNVDHRREQLVNLGLTYQQIERINLNGSQMGCAINVTEWLTRASSDGERQRFAINLKQSLAQVIE